MPELPDPPWRVLAKTAVPEYRTEEASEPRWYYWHQFGRAVAPGWEGNFYTLAYHSHGWEERPDLLTVIPHPLNDARAVEIIQKAQGAADANLDAPEQEISISIMPSEEISLHFPRPFCCCQNEGRLSPDNSEKSN